MADLYFINGGVNNYWNTAGNWASSSGGLHVAELPPTVTDHAIFDVNSPNCDTNAANRVTGTLTFNAYSNLITITGTSSNYLRVAGDITISLDSGTVFSALSSGYLSISNNGTITSNGHPFPVVFSFGNTAVSSNITINLFDDLTLSNGSRFGGTGNKIINGNICYVAGDFTITDLTTNNISGITNFVLNGTGTITSSHTDGGYFANNLEISTSGTITFASGGTFRYRTGILKYTAGTVITTGHTLRITGNTTLNTYATTWEWNNVTTANSVALTLQSILKISGIFSLTGSTTFIGAYNVNCGTLNSEVDLTHIFVSGQTYSITTLSFPGTSGHPITITASTAASLTYLVVSGTATCSYVVATDIDSSGGEVIINGGGTLSNTLNWKTFGYLDTGVTDNNNFNKGFTLFSYVYPNSGGPDKYVIFDKSSGVSGLNGFNFYLDTANKNFNFIVNSGLLISSATNSIDLDEWANVLLHVESGLSSIYINGVISGTPGFSAALSGITTNNSLLIGNTNVYYDTGFYGKIDNVKCWSRSLTTEEIETETSLIKYIPTSNITVGTEIYYYPNSMESLYSIGQSIDRWVPIVSGLNLYDRVNGDSIFRGLKINPVQDKSTLIFSILNSLKNNLQYDETFYNIYASGILPKGMQFIETSVNSGIETIIKYPRHLSLVQ